VTDDWSAGSRQKAPESLRLAREAVGQADALRRRREFDRAESICSEALRRRPDDFAAWHVLGLIHADRGDYQRAAESLGQAVQRNPQSWNILADLAGVCVRLEALELAANTLRQAQALNPHEPFVAVTFALARANAAAGRFREAAAIFEDLWDRGQHTLDVLTGLIELPAQVVRKDILGELDNVARDAGRPSADFDTNVMFVRAAALDKAGRYAEAWQNAATANRAIAARVKNELVAEAAARAHTLDRLRADTTRIVPAAPDNSQPISLFILGPSRSGKTSLETLVATLEGVRRGYETPTLENAIGRAAREVGLSGAFSLARIPPRIHPQVRACYAQELAHRAGSARVFTSTHPGYIEEASQMATILPNVRFIFVKRDVDDNVLRIFMRRYKQGNPHSYELKAARQYVEWYHAMIDTLAARMPDIARIVQYEDVVADSSAALSIAAALCHLPITDRTLPALFDDRNCAVPYRDFMQGTSE
jgi:Tfp pilus assembly protein PilF